MKTSEQKRVHVELCQRKRRGNTTIYSGQYSVSLTEADAMQYFQLSKLPKRMWITRYYSSPDTFAAAALKLSSFWFERFDR